MNNLNTLTIREAHEKLKSGKITSRQLVEACLNRIKETNNEINAFVYVNEEAALKRADEIDAEGNFDHPLTGIPFGIKDCYCSAETPSTASSHILEGFQPPYEATVVKKLKEVGAIALGKTNTDEFTMGGSTESSYMGVTKNPWNLECVAGGSSGGSTAAIAANMCLFTLGTDTGGSIRQPASYCGVTGLKVTYGRTSRFGVMSMASSTDTIGPVCKTVEDTAIVMNTIAGKDQNDATTPDIPVPDYTKALAKGLTGMKIGIPKEYFIEGMEAGVETTVRESIESYKNLGAEIVEISLPHTEYMIPVYYVIVGLEVSSNMARYDGIRYGLKQEESENLIDHYFQLRSRGFGAEVKRRIILGTYIHSLGYDGAYYIKAQKVRTLLKQDFEKAFEKVDVIMTPTAPTTAFEIGSHQDPIQTYLQDTFTVSGNLAGLPGVSIPCGFSNNKPVGLQIMGPQFGEEKVLQFAHAFQQKTDFHKKFPQI